MSKRNMIINSLILLATLTALFFWAQITMAVAENKEEAQIAKTSASDLCLCALLKMLDNENHDDGKCDYCGRKIGEFGHNVERESFCGKIYELHPKCAKLFFDTCDVF